MKTNMKENTALLALVLLLFNVNLSAQVAINTTASDPHASAMLDVSSSTKGVLISRMTSTERTNITTPADGLLVFDTTNDAFFFYNAGSSSWDRISSMWTYNSGEVTLSDNNEDVYLGGANNIGKLGVQAYGEIGIRANSDDNAGVYGRTSTGNAGIFGNTGASAALFRAGIWGEANDRLGTYGISYTDVGIQGVSVSGPYAGYFDGDVYTTGTYLPSARKLKSGEQALKGALGIIAQLQPKTYLYDTKTYKPMNLPEGKRYGLIAEELEQVLPQLVKDSKTELYDWEGYFKEKEALAAAGEPTENVQARSLGKVDFKAVNYTELIPILLAGIQEQQATIEDLMKRLEQLEQLERN